MGQWGAQGYALQGYGYQWILSHYYGGTAFATTSVGSITVQITEVGAPSSITVTVAGVPRTLSRGQSVTAASGQYLTVTSGKWSRQYPGTVEVTAGGVYDIVSLTQYVEGVVPFESSASWNAAALEAQAVAVRSYALAYTSGGKNPICDSTYCQVYGGNPTPEAGAYTNASNSAVVATGNQVLVCTGASCGAPGQVARTEYSASTGGYSAGGAFPAAVDAGDAVAPEHDWTTTLTLARVESAFPALGNIESVTVTQRNNLGDMGGRVLQMALTGSGGSESVSGAYFASVMGLDSDWFSITNVGPPPPISDPAVGMARTRDGHGYWVATAGGSVYPFGDARNYGSARGKRIVGSVVGMAATADGRGYWLVASGGGVYAFGDARFYGSARGSSAVGSTVAFGGLASGKGYWISESGGGVYIFGSARWYGSLQGQAIAGTVTALVPTPDGRGYWLATTGGGVNAFGDARNYGHPTLH